MDRLTDRAAGVDIEAGDEAVRRIARLARAPGEYDPAGFAVSVVERSRLVDGAAVRLGDRVPGLAASGFHSTGYSLARRIVFDVMGLQVGDRFPGTARSVADELLERGVELVA